MSLIIQTNRLTKSYGRSRGTLDVTCDIREGEVSGFLGPNGAGKTNFYSPGLLESRHRKPKHRG